MENLRNMDQVINALKIAEQKSEKVPLLKFYMAFDNTIKYRAEVVIKDRTFLYEISAIAEETFLFNTHTIPDFLELLKFIPPKVITLEIFEVTTQETKVNNQYIKTL